MKRPLLIAAVALAMTACSETYSPLAPEGPANTILMPGNDSECGEIDFSSCFAKVDMEFKVLYERNNTLSRRGEVEYSIASNANSELATVYLNETYTVTQALRNLDKFIALVERGMADGRYSACAGTQILERANWLYGKLLANDSDMSDAPAFACNVSPVASVTGSGSTTSGVVLQIDDPYHYTQDVYQTGQYHTYTYFIVERQNGTAWDHVVTTAVAEQTGPVTFTISDAATVAAGTYVYRVTQCDQVLFLGCSVPTLGTVVIPETGGVISGCPHDNRNDAKDKANKTKCVKDEKEDKDHDHK